MFGARIQDALQLQLAQLTIFHNIIRYAVEERICGSWQLDGTEMQTLIKNPILLNNA